MCLPRILVLIICYLAGRASAFPTPLDPLSPEEASGGISAVLHNNLWDCNYPLWYPFAPSVLEGDASERFRFRVWWE